jgi:CheY-like chemotaxis protein
VLSTGGETLRVLVAEDDRDTAETLRTLLDLCGCCVVMAHTSQQGIEAARRLEPHIVLCDIGLPGFRPASGEAGRPEGAAARAAGHPLAA